jgi:hypothetical protein
MKQAETNFSEFLNECFTNDGMYLLEKEYPKNVTPNCKWCPYGSNGMCDKGKEKVTFFS